MTHPHLTPDLLIKAYANGIFPMADPESGEIMWYDPDPRGILPLESAHISRRLARTARSRRFEVRVDTAFRAVMEACRAPRRGQEWDAQWISAEMIDAYARLHTLGFAHSVETWRDGRLVGGLYGVALRGLFAGESMFNHEPDAGKVALVHLIERLKRGGFVLLDAQMITPMTAGFGAIEISRDDYKARLAGALSVSAQF
jgi:leucyl/phenylalanyl-tRNA--protein transferase